MKKKSVKEIRSMAGFYLSPDGSSVIELSTLSYWKYGFSVLATNSGYIDSICDLSYEDFDLIFSAWTKLK